MHHGSKFLDVIHRLLTTAWARFHILEGKDVFDAYAAGRYIYVGSGKTDFFRVVGSRSDQLVA